MERTSYRYDTGEMRDRAERCEGISDIEEVLKTLQEERPLWKEQINSIISENRYTRTAFAESCGVSRAAVLKWCNGSIPSSRDVFIRIGFAAHYNLDEMNCFLKRYGKYPALYPKSVEDSVFIFVLNSNTYPHEYLFCQKVIKRIKEKIIKKNTNATKPYPTEILQKGVMSLSSVEELEFFIEKNAIAYENAYEKFYKQVMAYLIANMDSSDIAYDGKTSIKRLADKQGWSSSMKQCVSAIRNKNWFPLRRKVIALGIHLNLTVEQIDNLLQCAQMEPLCAKNPVECAIIYAVTDAELNNELCNNEDGALLYEHVYKIIAQLPIDISEAESLLNDLSGFSD